MNEILKKGGERDMNKQEMDNLTTLKDLPVTDEQADETKGGASGTGKTMAAEVLARELRLDP